MIDSFSALMAAAGRLPPMRVAVAGAAKAPVLTALREAVQRNLVCPILVGPEDETRSAALSIGWGLGECVLVHESGDETQIAARAVQEVAQARAGLLMKGTVSTAALLHQLLKVPQLRSGRRLSHVAVVQTPGYGRLQLHTDGGINIQQDAPVLKDIVSNAVGLSRALGQAAPAIAGLALVEKVSPDLPETGRMAEVAAWVDGGGVGAATMRGPVALDVAVSAEAAQLKGVPCDIAGRSDIFVGPNISATNFVVKALATLAGAQAAGIVLGAHVPVVLLSRSDSPQTKLLSLALARLYEDRGQIL